MRLHIKYGRVAAALAVAGIAGSALVSSVAAQTTIDVTNDAVTVEEDHSVTVDVIANDTPSTGLTLQSVSDPQHGSAVIMSGKVVYSPDADYSGSDSFAYTVTDGTSTDAGVVSVTVTAVNDAPVAHNDSVSTKFETSKVIDILANDEDADDDDLTIVLQSAPAHGTLSLDTDVQAVTYAPDADFTGSDSFTYQVSDGAANSNTATVTIEVKAGDHDVADGFNAKVLAACESEGGVNGLCAVYTSGQLPPWARAKIGWLILRLAPPPAVADPVVVACEAELDSDHANALCDVYMSGVLPFGIQKKVGAIILDIARDGSEGSSAVNNAEDDKDDGDKDHDKKDHKHGWGQFVREDKSWKDHHHDGLNVEVGASAQISLGGDDDHEGRDKDRDSRRGYHGSHGIRMFGWFGHR